MAKKQKMLVLTGIMLISAVGLHASGYWEIDGDGYQPIPHIGSFDGVVNATPADVLIGKGREHSVKALGDRRIVRHFEVDVKDGQLRIRNPWKPWNLLSIPQYRRIRFEVTMPELRSVRATGSGNITVRDTVNGDSLYLRTTGTGDITANGNTDVVEIAITGSGDIRFSGRCGEADIALSGTGDLSTDIAAGAITARATGSGSIQIRGSAESIQLRLSGTGEFRGNNFTAKNADITITGSGDGILAVNQDLETRLTGTGDFRLMGGYPNINARTTGIGRVVRGE